MNILTHGGISIYAVLAVQNRFRTVLHVIDDTGHQTQSKVFGEVWHDDLESLSAFLWEKTFDETDPIFADEDRHVSWKVNDGVVTSRTTIVTAENGIPKYTEGETRSFQTTDARTEFNKVIAEFLG